MRKRKLEVHNRHEMKNSITENEIVINTAKIYIDKKGLLKAVLN